ncbi:methyl-accepting chemotaxis protein [Butyrivibrio sp. ob235]|uniref:methyl-accepting chemotaxis protein n=1 Tax=Butyrivibrio sp. ob235 TaxID=1761780 RepID=UPI0008BBA8B3|nr:methyl-accepting chemotaxis protein [Butyrivibrio sp. ob235]SEL49389.1 methyl-accepting chemotaxis protein [Butyrivibrio sp. ob235]
MWKKMSIMAKMLIGIIPIVAIAMILMTYISVSTSRSLIQEQTTERNEAITEGNINKVDSYLDAIRTTAVGLAETVGATYRSATMEDFKDAFTNVQMNNELISGCGIWFEPFAYQGDQEYMGPYWYKDGSSVVETWDYSNAEYDYHNQEYYINAKALSKGTAKITDPYYDPTSGTVMSTCSAPIYNNKGEYIGCVTVDVVLDSIANIAGAITVGKTGSAMMVTSDGTYLYTADNQKVQDGAKITDEDNASLVVAASQVLANETGMARFEENGKYIIVNYGTVPEVNWKLMIRMNQDELEEDVNQMTYMMVGILIAALVISSLVVILLVSSIARNIASVKKFAGSLASGDFTVSKLHAKNQDELGLMSDSLNNMYESNRSVISQISDESEQISSASASLSSMANELTSQFEKIQSNMSGVNDAMMSSGAATEEVSASVEEVNTSVQSLADVSEESLAATKDIMIRAHEIEQNSQKAYDNAINIAQERSQELSDASEKAKVVEEISNMAQSIAEIADQINLLSLNASIEAARAGEHGKGFAVVASEINKLATDTAEAVQQIQTTIDGVQDAFQTLTESSQALLDFVNNTAAPDYENFVHVARQYGDDAQQFGSQSDQIAQMVENIRNAMNEVNNAIQNIAESTQETASHSSDITDSINTAADVVENVGDMSSKQEDIAVTLDGIVKNFKLR